MRSADIAFYKEMPIFNNLSAFYLDKLFDCVKKLKLRRNTYLVRQGERIKSIFIVREGELEVTYTQTKLFVNEYKGGVGLSKESRFPKTMTENNVIFKDSYSELTASKVI